MPKAKLKLNEAEAAKVPTIHSLVGSSTVDAFQVGKTFITTISARSSEQLVEFGRSLETVGEADIKAFQARSAAAKTADAGKGGTKK